MSLPWELPISDSKPKQSTEAARKWAEILDISWHDNHLAGTAPFFSQELPDLVDTDLW